jgi:thiamine biosynthesis lipoprotein
MKLDFGAIAKGYAAECAVRTLEHQGTPRCLVSIAGDIFAGDPPPGSLGWRVVIQSGQAAESTPAHADDWLTLHQAGCSTSGDVEQVITAGGKRQSHIIDIRTGFGSDRRRSVTVVAPRGWQSDALATTLYLLDDDAAQRLLNLYPGTHAIIFDRVQADDQDDGNAHIRRREMSSAAVRISAIR